MGHNRNSDGEVFSGKIKEEWGSGVCEGFIIIRWTQLTISQSKSGRKQKKKNYTQFYWTHKAKTNRKLRCMRLIMLQYNQKILVAHNSKSYFSRIL